MNLNFLDWTIVGIIIAALFVITVFATKYCRSVSDFLAANRLAGRYLLAVSFGFGGAISLVAAWEVGFNNGLPSSWWQMIAYPTSLLIALSGFVPYRYRETRVLTMAQFFQMRYIRRFRLFSGTLCWLAGLLNYGIFPAITAKFIIFFFGLPTSFTLWGVTLQMFPVIMLIYLSIAVLIACSGGQISIMLTDVFQGMLLLFVFVVIMFFLIYRFGGWDFWGNITTGLNYNATPGNSMINPLDTKNAQDFNLWYYLIGMMITVYTTKAWQGHSGYNAAARTPHEARMSGVIATWRLMAYQLCMALIPLAAYAVLKSPLFPELAAEINADLANIADPQTAKQMTVPVFLVNILPHGMLGLFAVVVIACAISCDDTYMHAWGTIFVQDVVMSFRSKPFDPKHHMLFLRMGIIGVAIFGFLWSWLFPLGDFIQMYFQITAAIYMGGAGSAIIGGLYWKRGSTPAAWAAMINGTVIGIFGVVVQNCWKLGVQSFFAKLFPHCEWIANNPDKFPLNGQYIYFIAAVSSVLLYILVSLLGPRHVHNMDKMLHRGEYADEQSIHKDKEKKQKFSFTAFIGITKEFTRFDKFLAWSSTVWSMGWFLVFAIVTILGVTTTWLTTKFWIELWWWKLIPFSVTLGVIATVWLGWGGIKDVLRMFHDLRGERIDTADNGFVASDDDDKKEN